MQKSSGLFQVFLDLPLSGLLTGELKYNQNQQQWHEVTICRHPNPHTFVLLLKASESNPTEVNDFNKSLEAVFDIILNPPTLRVRRENPVGERPAPLGRESFRQVFPGTEPHTMPTLNTQRFPQGAEAQSPPGSDMSSVRSPYQPLVIPNTKATEQMAFALAAAIQAGNIEKAQELAKSLAQGQTRLNVLVDTALEEKKAREQEVSVTVHVEDRESTGLALPDIKVRPSDTILDLKRSFLGKYGFPTEVQKWIIGKRICSDEETLSKCEVNTSGHTLYLYLLSARAVNITREDYRQQWQAQGGPGAVNVSSGSPQQPGPEYGVTGPPVTSAPQAFTQSTSVSQDFTLPSPQGQGQTVSSGGALRQQSSNSNTPSLAPISLGLSDLRGVLDPMSGSTSRSEQRRSEAGPGQDHVETVALPVRGSGQTTRPLADWQDQLGFVLEPQEPEASPEGWQCESCTLINQPTRPGCELCGSARPASYQVPSNFVVSDEERLRLERERQQEDLMHQQELRMREENYRQLLQVENSDLVANTEAFTCPICFDTIDVGEGILLRECLHQFCRTCLTDTVRLTEEAALKCPFQDETYRCDAMLQDREVRALVSEQVYERYLRRSLDVAESQASNSYHCKTPDCRGWCLYEDLVNFFRCPVCRHENCLTCRAIHEGMDCKQYQEDLRIRAANDEAAKQTQIMLKEMLEKGEAMPCPQCEVIVQKKDGCDWIRCSICKTEICWVTKGRRWGPKGEGDTSGGCKCRVGGLRCHPKCNNCH